MITALRGEREEVDQHENKPEPALRGLFFWPVNKVRQMRPTHCAGGATITSVFYADFVPLLPPSLDLHEILE